MRTWHFRWKSDELWRIFPTFLLLLPYLIFLFQQKDDTVIQTSLFTTTLSCDKSISIFNSRCENTSLLTEWGNQLASDVTYKQSLHFWDHESPHVRGRRCIVGMNVVMGVSVCITLGAQTHDRTPVRKPKKQTCSLLVVTGDNCCFRQTDRLMKDQLQK